MTNGCKTHEEGEMTTTQAVIFDIGGVLAHDVWEHLLLDEERGIAVAYSLDTDQVRSVGQDLWEKFAYRAATDDNGWEDLEVEYWNLFIQRLQLPTSVDEFIQLTDEFIRPVEGMIQLLERLHSRGIDLALCSNNTEFWFQRQKDKLNLDRFVASNRMILSNRIGVPKSSPGFEMFRAVIDALGIEKDLCIFVDDREKNIHQALEFGLSGIIFPSHSSYGALYLGSLLEKAGVF